MSSQRSTGLRARIAIEAARLMYEESIKQYFTAKRLACRRIFGDAIGARVRHHPSDLPSNGEIRDALLRLAARAEGSSRTRRLFAMRIVALGVLRALARFQPRQIGSVSTGHIRRGSDIDIQIFPDDRGALELHLHDLGWVFERERVTIQKHGTIAEYLHYHFTDVCLIELTVYEPRELGQRPRSSTDGKPIQRIRAVALEDLLAREHPVEWAAYLATGQIAGMAELRAGKDDGPDTPLPGPWDGLLEGDLTPLAIAEPGEEDDPDQPYPPLPGFEGYG